MIRSLSSWWICDLRAAGHLGRCRVPRRRVRSSSTKPMGPSPGPKGSNGVNVSYWANLFHPVPKKKCGKPIGVVVFSGKWSTKCWVKLWCNRPFLSRRWIFPSTCGLVPTLRQGPPQPGSAATCAARASASTWSFRTTNRHGRCAFEGREPKMENQNYVKNPPSSWKHPQVSKTCQVETYSSRSPKKSAKFFAG